MNYRINYGNGQVSGTYTSKVAAMRACAAQYEYDRKYNDPCNAYVEYYAGGGDWFRIGNQDWSYPVK